MKEPFSITLREDGIVRLDVFLEEELDGKIAAAILESLYAADTSPLKVLYIPHTSYAVSYDAVMVGKRKAGKIHAMAFIAKSNLKRISINSVMALLKPRFRFKLFDDEKKALEWLKSL